MAAVIEIRETQPDEFRLAADTVGMSLLYAPVDDEHWEQQNASWEASDSLSAWDRGQCVGHVGSYPVDTVVPGGTRLPTAAVARVGVLPTHRRRGLASTLVRRALQDAAARGQVLASLRASEGLIYGRFGFGVAGDAAEITLDPPAPARSAVLRAGRCACWHATRSSTSSPRCTNDPPLGRASSRGPNGCGDDISPQH